MYVYIYTHTYKRQVLPQKLENGFVFGDEILHVHCWTTADENRLCLALICVV